MGTPFSQLNGLVGRVEAFAALDPSLPFRFSFQFPRTKHSLEPRPRRKAGVNDCPIRSRIAGIADAYSDSAADEKRSFRSAWQTSKSKSNCRWGATRATA